VERFAVGINPTRARQGGRVVQFSAAHMPGEAGSHPGEISPEIAPGGLRQVTPPGHSAKSLRQATPPSHSARSLRQVTPPGHSAKSLRQVTPPSHSAKSLRQVTPPSHSPPGGGWRKAGRGVAWSLAKTRQNCGRIRGSVTEQERLSPKRACRARSTSPGRRPGFRPPDRPGPVGAVHRGRAESAGSRHSARTNPAPAFHQHSGRATGWKTCPTTPVTNLLRDPLPTPLRQVAPPSQGEPDRGLGIRLRFGPSRWPLLMRWGRSVCGC
jgi:hypothetical protein